LRSSRIVNIGVRAFRYCDKSGAVGGWRSIICVKWSIKFSTTTASFGQSAMKLKLRSYFSVSVLKQKDTKLANTNKIIQIGPTE